jgi:hypothetical protein
MAKFEAQVGKSAFRRFINLPQQAYDAAIAKAFSLHYPSYNTLRLGVNIIDIRTANSRLPFEIDYLEYVDFASKINSPVLYNELDRQIDSKTGKPFVRRGQREEISLDQSDVNVRSVGFYAELVHLAALFGKDFNKIAHFPHGFQSIWTFTAAEEIAKSFDGPARNIRELIERLQQIFPLEPSENSAFTRLKNSTAFNESHEPHSSVFRVFDSAPETFIEKVFSGYGKVVRSDEFRQQLLGMRIDGETPEHIDAIADLSERDRQDPVLQRMESNLVGAYNYLMQDGAILAHTLGKTDGVSERQFLDEATFKETGIYQMFSTQAERLKMVSFSDAHVQVSIPKYMSMGSYPNGTRVRLDLVWGAEKPEKGEKRTRNFKNVSLQIIRRSGKNDEIIGVVVSGKEDSNVLPITDLAAISTAVTEAIGAPATVEGSILPPIRRLMKKGDVQLLDYQNFSIFR